MKPHLEKVSQYHVSHVSHYQSLQRNFLVFEFALPAGDWTATEYTGGGVIVDGVETKSAVFSTPFWSSHYIPSCLDYVVVTNDPEADDNLLERLGSGCANLNSRFYYNGTGPSAHELCTLLNVVGAHPSSYNEDETQCFWFAHTVFTSIYRVFPNTEPVAAIRYRNDLIEEKHAGVMAPILDAVCTKYDEVYTAELALKTEKGLAKVMTQIGYYYIPCTYFYPGQDARACGERKAQGMAEKQVREEKMKQHHCQTYSRAIVTEQTKNKIEIYKDVSYGRAEL